MELEPHSVIFVVNGDYFIVPNSTRTARILALTLAVTAASPSWQQSRPPSSSPVVHTLLPISGKWPAPSELNGPTGSR